MAQLDAQVVERHARLSQWFAGRFAPAVVLGTGALALSLLLMISGGVNSQFSVLVPLFPFFGVLLAGRTQTLCILAFWVVLVAIGTIYNASLPGIVGEAVAGGEVVSRGVWLIIALIGSTFFALHFDKLLSRLQARLQLQASQDPLTCVANRRALDEFLDRELVRRTRSGSSLSLLMIDVDHFKRINDQLGRGAGDLCLQQVAQALEDNTRAGQDLVARFGGEEFVVVLTETNMAQAYRVAENIRGAVANLRVKTQPDDQSLVTVTVGCATADHETTADALFKTAGRALFRGKTQGSNCVVWPVLVDQPPGVIA